MVNRRASRDEDDTLDVTHNANNNSKTGNRKGSKTSDYSDNKKSEGRNGDRSDNLKKRDAPSSRNNRKDSVSSDDDNDRRPSNKSRGQDKGRKDKKAKFDSSDDEKDHSASDNESDKSSHSDDNDRKYAPGQRNGGDNKRTKQFSDNVEYEIYFGDVSFDASEDELRRFFGNCGDITQVKLLMRDDGKSRGRGFIKFSDEKGLKNALKLNGTDMMGRKVVVEIPANASAKRTAPGSTNGGAESNSVIVRNLPFNIQEDEFGNIFEDCGAIKKFRIIKNENGQSKGFGFVDFEDQSSAKNALSKSGLEINGRSITVDFSIPKDNRGGSFGGHRGGDRGDRGDRGGRGGFRGNSRGRGGYGNNRSERGYRNRD